jgi:hypothetical protein
MDFASDWFITYIRSEHITFDPLLTTLFMSLIFSMIHRVFFSSEVYSQYHMTISICNSNSHHLRLENFLILLNFIMIK